ncbi:MAG: EamA family transporter [Gemmataceae bacterium]|nr:EamA family transporter [Gemmataceae bacterium]
MDESTKLVPGWHWFALGSAFFAALTALLGKVGVSELNSNRATLIRTAVVLVLTAGIITWRGEWQAWTPTSNRAAIFLVLSGVATGLSWLCYYRALQMAPASRVAPLDKLSVGLVILFAIVFLGEPLTWKVALGGTLVVAGVVSAAL